MARTALTPIALNNPYGAAVAVTYTAGDAVNGNQYVCTGRERLLVKNGDGAAPHTFTLKRTTDPFGTAADQVITVPLSAEVATPTIPQVGFIQADGNVYIDVSSAQLSFAVLQPPF
jgi:hypothetical protein